jgi:hypothetical protein
MILAEAELRLEPAKVTVGEPFSIVIEMSPSSGEEISFPDSLSADPLRIFQASEKTLSNGKAQRRYQAACFKVGEFDVGPFSLEVKGTDGKREVKTPAKKLSVVSVVSQGDPKVQPLRGTLEAPHSRGIDLFIALSSLGLGILVGFIARLLRREKLKPAPPPVPPHVRALNALRILETRDLSTEEAITAFFVEVSGIVRHYIEERFGLRAPELTTEEFLDVALRGPGLVAEHRTQLGRFLERADLVKFARHRPEPATCRDALSEARGFVNATRAEAEATREMAGVRS